MGFTGIGESGVNVSSVNYKKSLNRGIDVAIREFVL
jgi:hypothetical protein